MDAFENLVAMLLKRDGYWTSIGVKVELTKAEKRKVGRPSSPRWEIDVVAYKGSTNELLAVECKSFLDSRGVQFHGGGFEPPERYKLFTDSRLQKTVLGRLRKQLVASGACRRAPKVTLALAAGKIASNTPVDELRAQFAKRGWRLIDPDWIYERLKTASASGYENDMACVVSKLILRRNGQREE